MLDDSVLRYGPRVDSLKRVEFTDSQCVKVVMRRIEDRLAKLRPEDKDKIARGIGTHDTAALNYLKRALEHLDR